MVREPRLELEHRIGYSFGDPDLFRQAMSHRSYVAEAVAEDATSNERLEFLGDAILGWVVADLAYHTFGDVSEGSLSDLRKSVVNATALADLARDLDLGQHLLLGRGEDAAGGRDKPSILSDALEALLGAIYLDGGHQAAFEIVERLFTPRLAAAAPRLHRVDDKSALQERVAGVGGQAPVYTVTSSGPDHEKRFVATVTVAGQVVGEGTGRSKKTAEQDAAGDALDRLGPTEQD